MRASTLARALGLGLFLGTVGSVAGCSTGATPDPAGDGTATPAGTTPRKPTLPTDTTTPPPGTPVDPTTDPNAKACTGMPGELYALSAKKLTIGTEIPLCRFQGSVLMIVNTASHCGNTPQYAPLEALYEKYRAQGFYILGFPSPQFGGQEFGTDQEVTTFCTNEYKITFPMFTIGDVNGANKQPVYDWVHSQPGGPPPDGYARDVQWNFEKYLVSRQGKIVARVENGTFPDTPEVVAQIEAELAKK